MSEVSLRGSCLCGVVSYVLTAEPARVSNCHCRMCQKQHGAPFGTYLSVRQGEVEYLSGEEALTAYNSSSTILRKFCRHCGSNMEWSGSPEFPEWISLPLTTLDSEYTPKRVLDDFAEFKCTWLE